MALNLHYIEQGTPRSDRLPLVILHGLLGSADNWRSALKAFGRDRHVIALDLRNHGASPHARDTRYTALAEDVVATLDALNIQRFDLIGHSMGGKSAMMLAQRYPHCVARLIVVDIAPVAYQHGHRREFDAMQAVASTDIESRQQADEIMQRYIDDLPTRQFLATNLKRDSTSGKLSWRVGLNELIEGYAEIAAAPLAGGNAEVPTLLIRGRDSDYATHQGVDALRELFPRLEVVTLDTGHWVHAQDFKSFKAAVDQFLGSE
ncbi:alpha/beta fold hydrolase [Carnimonas nigrificans]|uniref:alpha/beta fold hydrolase n=1 Tax=Carnimonas nigrificans TaxID=64323 RepID=UPI0004710FA2|nr:alpha/beta fold hydrolase [Carnimonas nigrificans]